MLVSALLGRRTREDPRDAQTPGHRILLRGGYIQQVGQGIFALLPLGQRSCRKVARIIREEMEAIGGQEVLLPFVTPAAPWEKSGRYSSVGSELVRFPDRTGRAHVLNMTHEEIVVEVVAAHLDSYRQLPAMIFQIQSKFRDEPRSRAGLLRVREFTMKDAYSFHRTQEDLERYYEICHHAYLRIFRRCGLKSLLDIRSDTGMMGGAVAHEYMVVTEVGEDTLIVCSACDYRANREVAVTARAYPDGGDVEPLVRVSTPGTETIEGVCALLGKEPREAVKAVAYSTDDDRDLVAFLRGDLEINETKLRNAVRARELRPMQPERAKELGVVLGYLGPVGLDGVEMVFDESVVRTPNLIAGANAPDEHLTGFRFERDVPGAAGRTPMDIAAVRDGDPCPECGSPLRECRGVEVGNIFQLGTKYSEAMGLTYLDEDGARRHPIMGCYGIGVGRTMATVIEEHHDEHGPLFPVSTAPFEVEVMALNAEKHGTGEIATSLYRELRAAGAEVILDDRKLSVGAMMADADLIGAPMRLVVSKRNLEAKQIEVKYRTPDDTSALPASLPMERAAAGALEILATLKEPYRFVPPGE